MAHRFRRSRTPSSLSVREARISTYIDVLTRYRKPVAILSVLCHVSRIFPRLSELAALFSMLQDASCLMRYGRVEATPRYNEYVNENAVQQIASADFPTRWGQFRIYGFRGESGSDGARRVEEAVALVMGDIKSAPPLVRVHSQCLTGDVFHSLRCDCRQQLELSLSMITEEGAGILIYEQQEGRGIGLMAKLQAYALQDAGLDTVEANERLGFKADQRDFTLPGEILKALGVTRVRLLSNNPDKVEALERAGVHVVERVPCEVTPSPHAEEYLKTKKEKLGHLFTSS